MAKQNRMQAVLVVRSRICFIFDRATSPQQRFDAVSTNFHEKIYRSNYSLLIRFMLVTTLPPTAPGRSAATLGLDRIAVLFQPHYSVDPKEAARADIVFDISRSAKPPRANPFQGKIAAGPGGAPPTVKLMAADFNFEDAWRVILGVQNAAPGVIRDTDLNPVTRLVETQQGEPLKSRNIVVFP